MEEEKLDNDSKLIQYEIKTAIMKEINTVVIFGFPSSGKSSVLNCILMSLLKITNKIIPTDEKESSNSILFINPLCMHPNFEND